MRLLLTLWIVCLPAFASPVDDLVSRLSQSGGLWINGVFPTLDLPSTATDQQVLSRLWERTSSDQGHIQKFTVVDSREVCIDGQTYRALTVDTDQGRKIVLTQYQSSTGWWTKVFAAPQE